MALPFALCIQFILVERRSPRNATVPASNNVLDFAQAWHQQSEL
nr:hypothetical protein [Cupriavidus taiwanensis]